MRRIILLIIALFLFNGLHAQKIVIINEATEKPISKAIVSVDNKDFVSNDSGHVQLKKLEGRNVVVMAEGYLIEHLKFDDLKKQGYKIYVKKNVFDLDEITISANKWEQRVDEIPVSIVPVRVSDIDFTNPQTTADLLGSNGHVFIQKSQLGGGSPMIRGFSANRVLIIVDGIRMNNAIYRSGNLQNVISVDPNSLEQAEIVLGPGSVIYGSDALGGVMDFHITKPVFSNNDKNFLFKANVLGRYSSANNENTVHLDLNFGFKKIAFYTSYSYSRFEDLKMGTVN
ncbi:MAG: TonB-dependent receptor plug domain-containing protein, partial [Bacteroidota bacterium]|nr:TonB-dependent receptor plug domain-containing protein [Bacteroidota bacterium]